jgi:hypothetical protein
LSAGGKTVAIGAPYNNGNAGHVRVYRYNTVTLVWQQRGDDIDDTISVQSVSSKHWPLLYSCI